MAPAFSSDGEGRELLEPGSFDFYPKNYYVINLRMQTIFLNTGYPCRTWHDIENAVLGTDIDPASRTIGFDVYIIDRDEGDLARNRLVWQNDATKEPWKKPGQTWTNAVMLFSVVNKRNGYLAIGYDQSGNSNNTNLSKRLGHRCG